MENIAEEIGSYLNKYSSRSLFSMAKDRKLKHHTRKSELKKEFQRDFIYLMTQYIAQTRMVERLNEKFINSGKGEERSTRYRTFRRELKVRMLEQGLESWLKEHRDFLEKLCSLRGINAEPVEKAINQLLSAILPEALSEYYKTLSIRTREYFYFDLVGAEFDPDHCIVQRKQPTPITEEQWIADFRAFTRFNFYDIEETIVEDDALQTEE
jgi:hypothetical protein